MTVDAVRLKTIGDCLEFGIRLFDNAKLTFGHGTTNARDEAAYLILHTLGLPLDVFDHTRRLSDAEASAITSIFKQRVALRIPAAYLTQEAWLGKFKFFVDERFIVPRSFIAELLNKKLSSWAENPKVVTDVLELCTGSGCLAILASHAFPNAKIIASDISAEALAVAKINVKNYDLDARISLIKSDLFRGVPKKPYDLIIANPPYVDAAAMRALPKEYRHEPKLALAGGANGLTLVQHIIDNAADFLKERGILIVEIGHHRSMLKKMYPHMQFCWPKTPSGNGYVFILEREKLVRMQSARKSKAGKIKETRAPSPRENASRNEP